MELDELKDCSYKPSKMITGKYTLELSNHEVQDILEDLDSAVFDYVKEIYPDFFHL